MVIRVEMLTRRTDRNRAAPRAAMTAATDARVVFSHATARYSSGRRRMWALRRLSSSSWSSCRRAWTKAPNVFQASCSFGERPTDTGFAPFGSFTMWCAFAATSSPGRKRFVFVRVRRVSSFSKAVLPNRLTSRSGDRGRALLRPSHLLPDALGRLFGVLVVTDDELRDLAEVEHGLLVHVVDDIDPPLDLGFHLLVGHVLHFHDLVEQEGVPLVDERVRRGVPLVDRVRDELVRLGLEPDELDDLLDAPDNGVSDPGVGLDDHEVEGRQEDPRGVDRRVLETVDHRLHGVRVHRGHRRVPRGHGLEHRVRLLPANFPDDDVVRPLPEGPADEVVHVDLAARLPVGPALPHAGPGRARDRKSTRLNS